MSAAQGVQLILDDGGPQRRDDDFLVALRMGIVSPQRVPASVADTRLDRDPFVHLLDGYPRAAVPFVPGLSARRAPRGSALGGAGARRRGSVRLRRGGSPAGSPLAEGQLLLELGDARRLLFHDLLKLDKGALADCVNPVIHWVSRACACFSKTASRVPLYLAQRNASMWLLEASYHQAPERLRRT